MTIKLTEEEAIRHVIKEGISGDFCDLAEVVKKQFGLLVSTGLIEDVYRKIQREGSTTSTDIGKSSFQHQPDEQLVAKVPINIGRIDLAIREEIPKSDGSLLRSDDQKSKMGSTAGNKQDSILEFVRMMGGFDAAREAITELERSLKQLMK